MEQRVLFAPKCGRQTLCAIYFYSNIYSATCVQSLQQSDRLSRRLMASSAAYTFSFYMILCLVLLAGILYHFVFRRKSRDAFLRHETTAGETMLRQDVIARYRLFTSTVHNAIA